MIKNGKCNVTKECRLAELPTKIAGRLHNLRAADLTRSVDFHREE